MISAMFFAPNTPTATKNKAKFSYYTNNRGKQNGLRFDHIFASHLLEVVECEYLHELREVKRPRANRSAFAPKAPIRPVRQD